MSKKSIIIYIFPPFLFVILLSITVISIFISVFFKDFHLNIARDNLTSKTLFLETTIRGFVVSDKKQELNDYCSKLAEKTLTRITVIATNGKIISDSYKNPSLLENHSNRPEIIQAIQGQSTTKIRYSATQSKENMYFAMPIYDEGNIIAVLRTSNTIHSIHNQLKHLYYNIFYLALIIAIIAIILSLIITRKISYPLEQVKNTAASLAKGVLFAKSPSSSISEIDDLSRSINYMATAIQNQIQEITKERNQSKLILHSMLEGVIALDQDNKIITINQAAKRILNININTDKKMLSEVIRNSEFENFIDNIKDEPISQRIEIKETKYYILDAKGVPLNIEGNRFGTLVVINNITQIVKLENIRKDFAANVSHELKTPLTAIKGAVETLLDGAINTDKSENFVNIIHKHSERLNALIQDILTLAKIEQEAEISGIEMTNCNILELIETAIDICQEKINQKNLIMDISCDRNITNTINRSMIEQVLVNLIDNAIKYSDEHQKIRIKVKIINENFILSVKDYGCGIAQEHIPRLFERFYRVSKSRSRQKGGTGLGLAIVKHITQAHQGTVSVESEVNDFTKLTLTIPKT